MANLINLWAESGANIIGDDAEPTLELTNSSTGPGLRVGRLNAVSTASIDVANLPKITGAAAGSPVLELEKTVAGNYSTSTLKLTGSSVASGCVIELTGTAFTSVMSIDWAAGDDWATAGAIRVKSTDGDTMYWIPLLPDSALEAVAPFE